MSGKEGEHNINGEAKKGERKGTGGEKRVETEKERNKSEKG